MKMQKFIFEDFLGPASPPPTAGIEELIAEEDPPAPTFNEAEMAEREATARQTGFQEGYEAGYAKAKAEIEHDYQQLSTVAQQLGAHLHGLSGQLDAERSAREAATMQLAVAIAKKLTGMTPDDAMTAAVTPMLTEVLRTLYHIPHITAFTHPTLAEGLEALMPKLIQETLYRGTVTITPDATLDPGSCRVEWQGGQAVRSQHVLWQQVESLLLGGAATPHSATSSSTHSDTE